MRTALLIGLLAGPAAAAPAGGASVPGPAAAQTAAPAEGVDPRVYAGRDPLIRSILQGGTISAVRDPKDGGKVLYIRRGTLERDAPPALSPAAGDLRLPKSRLPAAQRGRTKKAKAASPRVDLDGQAPKQLNGMGEKLDEAAEKDSGKTADGARAGAERLWGGSRPEK